MAHDVSQSGCSFSRLHLSAAHKENGQSQVQRQCSMCATSAKPREEPIQPPARQLVAREEVAASSQRSARSTKRACEPQGHNTRSPRPPEPRHRPPVLRNREVRLERPTGGAFGLGASLRTIVFANNANRFRDLLPRSQSAANNAST